MRTPKAQPIEIRDESIRLGQLLKLASLAEDGLQAKELIEHGLVKVNGDIETRRGRQLRAGDVVEVNGEAVQIESAG
ncbi:RNA-binding S4 domain-containing protein [Paeniglutamicibacter cryotolerans]|uniref:Ribosome-associated protein n=1 Tax=Paeniglutamicibacter cryotolerans TaxID=670079 RepID=A0A839QJS3_9MICC|nr:RNA-binding S4 domain-containing protein [Paeniglutamicibacter cryotolerans]MBB2996090.1 ribosome-associated protein [Paeniglutamicibacter cryotolerans]